MGGIREVVIIDTKKETWGISKKADVVHFFRMTDDGRAGMKTICEGRNHKRRWLFISRPKWVPGSPGTCPVCMRILELEKIEEQARRNGKTAKV